MAKQMDRNRNNANWAGYVDSVGGAVIRRETSLPGAVRAKVVLLEKVFACIARLSGFRLVGGVLFLHGKTKRKYRVNGGVVNEQCNNKG